MTAPQTPFQEVGEFHTKFKQPRVDGPPSLEAIEDRIPLRMGLIAEEFEELVEAVYGKAAAEVINRAWHEAKALDDGTRDLIETVDALGDLTYVINGMAIEANVDLDKVVTHIHESNMSKLGEDGEPILATGEEPEGYPKGKILKGPNFWRPDIAKVINS